MRGVEETFINRRHSVAKNAGLTKSAGNPSAFFRPHPDIQVSKMAFSHNAKAFIAINK
jgi:hypothetical protein